MECSGTEPSSSAGSGAPADLRFSVPTHNRKLYSIFVKPLRTAAALSLLALAGCSTLADTFNPTGSESYLGRRGPNILGGTRLDVDHIGDPECKTIAIPFFALDLPFSFALDLVFLPYTLGYSIVNRGRGNSETRRNE